VPRRILYGQAQLTTALVQIERACLKNGFGAPRIKISKRDEVVDEFKEVAVIADEFVDCGNGIGLRFKSSVAGNQG